VVRDRDLGKSQVAMAAGRRGKVPASTGRELGVPALGGGFESFGGLRGGLQGGRRKEGATPSLHCLVRSQ
jgi:hypothetical protein